MRMFLAIKSQARFVLKELSSSNARLRVGDVLRHPLLPLSLQEMNRAHCTLDTTVNRGNKPVG